MWCKAWLVTVFFYDVISWRGDVTRCPGVIWPANGCCVTWLDVILFSVCLFVCVSLSLCICVCVCKCSLKKVSHNSDMHVWYKEMCVMEFPPLALPEWECYRVYLSSSVNMAALFCYSHIVHIFSFPLTKAYFYFGQISSNWKSHSWFFSFLFFFFWWYFFTVFSSFCLFHRYLHSLTYHSWPVAKAAPNSPVNSVVLFLFY